MTKFVSTDEHWALYITFYGHFRPLWGVILHRISKIPNFGAKMRCPRPLKVPESDFNYKMMLPYVEYNIYLYQLMSIGHYI